MSDSSDTRDTTSSALDARNGSNLNGSNLNGSNLNGSDLSGFLVAVRRDGVTLSRGISLSSTSLSGGMLTGLKDGHPYRGMDFQGAHLVGELGGGSRVSLRIDHVTPGTGADSDVWRYDVSYYDLGKRAWSPVCPDGSGGNLAAIPVDGVWEYRQGVSGGGAKRTDATRFTFGCAGGAIAKCIGFGYKPWARVNGSSLANAHQTCTRLIRADYCGDGRSHTTNGRLINLYDALGIQHDTEAWLPEAEWDTQGARCFNALNRSLLTLCSSVTISLSCGNHGHFATGTLLMSETPAGPLGGL